MPKASQGKEHCIDLSRTSLDVAEPVVFLETSDGLGWPNLHAAVLENRSVERIRACESCLWINMPLEQTDIWFAIDGRNDHTPLAVGTLSILAPGVPMTTRFGNSAHTLDVSIAMSLVYEVAGELFDCPSDIEFVSAFGLDNPSMASLMHAVMWALREPYHNSTLRSEYLARALAVEVLAKHAVARRKPLVADAASCLGRHQLQRVLDYIEENLTSDLSLNELAAVAGLSRTLFIQRFKHSLQHTPHRYVMSARVRRGQEMLANSDLPITHVATACGFADHAHFTSVFRRTLGVTPSTYRQTMR